MQLNLKRPLAFFDLEATGVDVSRDRIVEISILKIHPDQRTEKFTKRVNPKIPIPIEASLIHGIYDADVANEPTFKEIGPQVRDFIDNSDLGGYNIIKFDLPMLAEEMLRNEIEFDTEGRKIVDSMKIFHLMEPRSLKAAYKFYCNAELENAHSAEADNIATFEVFKAQLERYNGVTITDQKSGKEISPVVNDVNILNENFTPKFVDLAGMLSYNSKGEVVYNFGKHKNKTVLEMLKLEPNYYDWIMKSDFPQHTKKKLTEIYLKYKFENR